MAQDNSIKTEYRRSNTETCSVCNELLSNIHRFFDALSEINNRFQHNWLTVDDIAKELKISKSIVYRLIRNGELEAVNIVENNGKISRKGHYRIQRKSLDNYINQRKVNPLPDKITYSRRSRNLQQVKNHLGL
jgi:excisionase family DNA binding protein